MTIASWKMIVTSLSLGGLVLTACDKGDDGDEGVAGPGETEGASETDAPVPATSETTEGPGETEGSGETETAGETEGEVEACDNSGDSRECTTAAGEAGTQFCDSAGVAGLVWHECLTYVECTPGTSRSCGFCPGGDESGGECDFDEYCNLYSGVPDWDTNHGSDGGCNTPLVFSFDGRPVQLDASRAATFDLDGIGGCITSDWPQASTPWLALDRDGNGSIDSGRELFGSGTRLASGKRAAHGFAALAELDDNGDGRIDGRDPAFSQLVAWGDEDGDRRSTFAEAEPLAHHRILSIELGYHIARECDDRGNCGVERAAFHYIDAHGEVREGEVVDLHLACQ